MDLVAGLHWLRENLPAFNGNPNMVTLMGHGHGAALANILIVSPVASGMYSCKLGHIYVYSFTPHIACSTYVYSIEKLTFCFGHSGYAIASSRRAFCMHIMAAL